jgi:hypothetical protein
VNLHVAEYEALMTRNTYLMTLQFSLLPVAALIISFVAPMWSHNHDHNRLLVWGIYGMLLTIAVIWSDTLWEMYNNVVYLEKELKPLVRQAAGRGAFWMYEPFLARLRGHGLMLWELALPLVSMILWSGTVWKVLPFDSTWPFPRWQYCACALAGALNWRLFQRTLDAIKLRRRFSASETEVAPPRRDYGIFIKVTTLILGIIPFLLLTWRQGTLWPDSSRVNAPLLSVPSVWFGDTFILPFFNVQAIRLLRATGYFGFRRGHLISWTVSLGIAASIAGSSHYMWTQDHFYGFIDPIPGRLSPVGWWHLGFTVLEMTVVLVFLRSWFQVSADGDPAAHLGCRAWWTFLPYSLLSIADFVIMHLWLLPKRGVPDYSWHTAWEGLIVLPFWGIMFGFAVILRAAKSRRHNRRVAHSAVNTSQPADIGGAVRRDREHP